MYELHNSTSSIKTKKMTSSFDTTGELQMHFMYAIILFLLVF